jgi:hypothetical protein
MTPHNEHIMLKLARAEQHEHAADAEALSRAAWAAPRRWAMAAGLVSGAVLVALLVVAALWLM